MRIQGTFKDQNNATITVIIENKDITANDIDIDNSSYLRFSDEPVVITTDIDDSFDHIIKTSATINLTSQRWLGDYLFADNYTSIVVNVLKGNTVIFAGYVTPNTFSQDYAHAWDSFTLNCVDKLSILENKYLTEGSDYETVKANVSTKSFSDIIAEFDLVSNDIVLSGTNTPKIYYDNSKSYGSYSNIFKGLLVAEGLFLGDDEDDLWSNEEILDEILRYLNLHIYQSGYDYYIFDWENVRQSNEIHWHNISDSSGAIMLETRTIDAITRNMYGSDDTQLSVADVYNQVQVKDSIEELETVINSPFDNDDLVPVAPKHKYLVEYGTNGNSIGAMRALTALARYDTQPNTDKAYTREWWMQVFQNTDWSFKLNGNDVYDRLNGQPNNFLKYLFETPFASAVVGFGSGNKITNKNNQNIENIDVKDKYILLNVMGTGVDEKSSSSPKWPSNWTTSAHPVWPNDSVLENLNMAIEYNYGVDGSYSPGSPDVTNYLVFNGEMLLTTVQETLGVSGFDRHAAWIGMETDESTPYWERNNQYTQDANDNRAGHWGDGNYVDFLVFTRKNNNFITAKSHLKLIPPEDEAFEWYGRMTPDESDEKGHYYMQQFYNDNGVADEGHIYLSPPIVQGSLAKRFNYRIGEKTSYYQNDVIKYIDILACELKVGDKWCVESHDSNGNKTFAWLTESQIQSQGITYPYIYLAINIDDGEFLIGDVHKIYNNISSDMYLEDTTGMAIPIKSTDAVSGTVHFKIIGPVNNTWDNGIRRHPTWFRHTTYTENYVSILPHVGQIWIKDFDVKLVSDNGKQTIGVNDDIVYCSDEQDRFIKKKDDIEFRLTTALTAEEAAELGVSITTNKSDVIGADTNIPITAITNNITNETDKPEKFYVDAYYREYCTPKLIMESTLHSGIMLGLYSVGYLNRNFLAQGVEYNVRTAKKKLKLKEL